MPVPPSLGPVLTLVVLGCALAGCSSMDSEGTFGDDVAFLRQHVETIVLGTAPKGPRVAVVPAYQGRVMTSSADGEGGASYGWINYELIRSGTLQLQFNPLGGEDRFWLGPEGGQYAIFFAPGSEFDLNHWQTPAVIDREEYGLVSRDDNSATFRRITELTNYSGTQFKLTIEREIRLLDRTDVERHLGVELGWARAVAYQSDNRITNLRKPWTKEGGMLSIWILGMYKPSPATTVVIPFQAGSESERGRIVNDEYFGKVPADRLVVGDTALFFAADGVHRSKIGLGPKRARPVCGSWDAAGNVLTIVQYNQPGPEVTDYVNSMWELQEQPYGGDVINSYNDGPTTPGGKPLGPFYELETSSPAVALGSNETVNHVHRTIHLAGPREELDRIAQAVLGVDLQTIEGALQGR